MLFYLFVVVVIVSIFNQFLEELMKYCVFVLSPTAHWLSLFDRASSHRLAKAIIIVIILLFYESLHRPRLEQRLQWLQCNVVVSLCVDWPMLFWMQTTK